MGDLTKIHQNYDSVFKHALSQFQEMSFEFLRLDIAKVETFLNVEEKKIVVENSYRDLLLKLVDGTGVHLEWQSGVSRDDMLRFAIYNLNSTKTHKLEFRTIIFTNRKPKVSGYFSASLSFKPTIVNLGEFDGDAMLVEIKRKITDEETINVLELIYLPLYKSIKKPIDMVVDEVIPLVKKVTKGTDTAQVMVLLAVIVNKFIANEADNKRLEEALDMFDEELVLFKVVKNKGIRQGRKEGKEEGIQQGIEQGQKALVRELLKNGVSYDVVMRSASLTKKDLMEIKEEVACYSVLT